MLKTNLFCRKSDLSNESSVEMFFINRLLSFLGYSDSDIKTKQSINELEIGKGSKKEKYKPDYICFVDNKPSVIYRCKKPKGRDSRLFISNLWIRIGNKSKV